MIGSMSLMHAHAVLPPQISEGISTRGEGTLYQDYLLLRDGTLTWKSRDG